MHSGPYPPLAWAWPRGERDLLLHAGLDPDHQRAEAALNRWFASHSIEQTDGGEHRLLALVAERFAPVLKQRPEGPRMTGLRRQHWTRSQLVLSVARPALQRMAQAGLAVIVLGQTAARCATSGSGAGAQLQTLDICLADDDLDPGLAALGEAGWLPWSGESMLCLRRRAPSLRAMQLQHGQLGSLGVQRWPLGDLPAVRHLHDGMVRRATACTLDGVPVLLPGATYRLAMALGRQSVYQPLNALLDAALLLNSPDLDGDLLLEILDRSQSLAQAQIICSYLHDRLHLPLPAGLQASLPAQRTSPRERLLAIAHSRCAGHRWLLAIGRLVSPRLRGEAACGPYSRPGACLGWAQPMAGRQGSAQPPGDRQWLRSLAGQGGPVSFQLELGVYVPTFGQELVFELQTERLHLIQLRAWSLWPVAGGGHLRFRGLLLLPEADQHLWISARPSRQLRPNASEAARRRHGPCTFRVSRFVLHAYRNGLRDGPCRV